MNESAKNVESQLIEYINLTAQEYDITKDDVAKMLSESIVNSFNKFLPDCVLKISFDLESGTISSLREFTVVEDAEEGKFDDFNEITLSEANKNGEYKIGDIYTTKFDINDPTNFGDSQIRNIIQNFKQKLKQTDNSKLFAIWSPKIGQLINAEVEKFDERGKFYLVNLDEKTNKNLGFLSSNECIPLENLTPGKRYTFLVKDVKEESKGWPVLLSRGDAKFVEELLKVEIPEIQSGEIEIKKSVRVAGFKTKIVVVGHSTNYDPIAICVGPKGSRIKAISEKIMNERIEIIHYNADWKSQLIIAAGPKNIIGINVKEQENSQPHVQLIVTEESLPLIIGKKGNNIKLLSRLAGVSIDVSTEEDAIKNNITFEKINAFDYIPEKPSYNRARRNFITNDELLEELSTNKDSALYDQLNNYNNQARDYRHNNNQPRRKTFEPQNNHPQVADEDLASTFAEEIANIMNKK